MNIITRLNRLFQADAHALLNDLEDPVTLLRQSVRDMEQEIAGNVRQLDDLQRRRQRLLTCQAEQQRTLAEIEQQLELCFRMGQDTLVRPVLRRKLENQRRLQMVERESELLQKDQVALEQLLAERRARLTAIQDRMELLMDDRETPGSFATPGGEHDTTVSDDEIELALLAEQARRNRGKQEART